jgi:hypothetical protein
MAFESEFDVERGNTLIRARCRGALSDAFAGEAFLREVVLYASQHSIRNILLDVRELSVSYSAEEMMDVMARMRSERWLEGVRVARLYTQEDFSNMLIVDIAESLHIPVKNFTSEQLALAWLKE